MKEIANTRLAIANLLGFKTYAEYQLQNRMAENTKNVYDMLNQLKSAYLPVQKADMKELTEYASKLEGKPITIMPWDYSYYSNKEKDEKYKVNDELLRPYFELSNVTRGIFGLATRLYGLHFTENYDAQVFNAEMKAYDVTDENGKFMGMLYTDFFPRSTKQSGAWMTNFREQYVDENGNDVRPIVTLTMNFTRPTDTKPSLLTFYEVETFIHEFGHGLHSLLALQVCIDFGNQRLPRFRGNAFTVQRELSYRARISRQLCQALCHGKVNSARTNRQGGGIIALRRSIFMHPPIGIWVYRYGLAHHYQTILWRCIQDGI